MDKIIEKARRDHLKQLGINVPRCHLYCFYDRDRSIFINPFPIGSEGEAIQAFGTLFTMSETYIYSQYERYDLYHLGSYDWHLGTFGRSKPRLVKRGTAFKPNKKDSEDV